MYKSQPRHKEDNKLEEEHNSMSINVKECRALNVLFLTPDYLLSFTVIERITYALALVLIDVIEDHNL